MRGDVEYKSAKLTPANHKEAPPKENQREIHKEASNEYLRGNIENVLHIV